MNYPWLPVNKLLFTEAKQKAVKLDEMVERGTSPDLQSK